MPSAIIRRRILSLDGGGIRGVISIEVLAALERHLRKIEDNPQMVLADWFDLVAGTSTGAIIATAISLGWSVAEIRSFYLDRGKEMFDHAHWWKLMHNRYQGERLKALLRDEFRDEPLGSARLRTLLMLVMRNVTTDQPWIVTNNPKCRFNRSERPDSQLNLPLWQLVRASTAAPSFFPPETIRVGEHDFVFVDGSISSYTNPAFLAFLRGTAAPYDVCWPTGEDRLLVVSVGTGTAPHQMEHMCADDYGLMQAATMVPSSLILSTVLEQDMLCRIFGRCLTGHQLDREIGDLVGASSLGKEHLFTYLRYNDELSPRALERMGLSDILAENVQRIDSVKHVPDLIRIGQKIAEQVLPQHLAAFAGPRFGGENDKE